MKKTIWILFFSASLYYPLQAQHQRTSPLIIDHRAISLFDSIPDSLIGKAADIELMFRHASVGSTINNGLDCVQGTRTSPAICKTFIPYKYDRRLWEFQGRANSGWYGKINDFVEQTALQIDSFDLFSFKYCYLEGLDELAEPCGKPFSKTAVTKAWTTLKDSMESLEKQYPGKIFVWWTIPLTQPGQHCTDTLNFLMREYAKAENKILFDIADIQCHDTDGIRLVNAYGWEMAFSGYCGEAPPGPSCHPNWTGSVMLAKAFWYMMTCIAGDVQPPVKDSLPALSTTALSEVTFNSALSGGNISDDGGLPVTDRGVVWGIAPNPDVSSPFRTHDGNGSGNFTSSLTGLDANTLYYVRAYAFNAKGTAYGNELSFTTDFNTLIEQELDDVLIYPNPSLDEFFMHIPVTAIRIQVIRPNGEVLHDALLNKQDHYKFKLNEKGVFILRLYTQHQVILGKLVVVE